MIVGADSGVSLQGADSLKNTWESIFAQIRKLLPEENRLATVLTNLTMMSFLGGYQLETDSEEQPDDPLVGFMKVLPYKVGTKGYTPLQIQDIKQATRLQWSIISQMIQAASFSSLEYGNLTFPLPAVAISKLTAMKDQILIPRLNNLALYYRELFRMMIKQYINGGFAATLGEEGKTLPSGPQQRCSETPQTAYGDDCV